MTDRPIALAPPLSPELRYQWEDLYQRYRWLQLDPKKRLQDQRYDHIAWANLGRNRQP